MGVGFILYIVGFVFAYGLLTAVAQKGGLVGFLIVALALLVVVLTLIASRRTQVPVRVPWQMLLVVYFLSAMDLVRGAGPSLPTWQWIALAVGVAVPAWVLWEVIYRLFLVRFDPYE